MATINHGSGADIIVPSIGGTTYRGLGGDDTYILSNSIAANAAITIVDTSGSNKIQLVDGLSIASSKFAADAVQLTLSNGAVVTINGASNFSYDLGGNATSGLAGSSNTLSAFASSMGVATLPSSGTTAGSSDVTINNSGVSSSASPTFTVTKSASKVAEGSDVTFTITASSAVSSDTTFSWSAMGDTNGTTVTAAANADITTLSGSATIASGSTSTTFTVGAVSDAVVEGLEGMKVSVFDANAVAVSSNTVLIDNTGSAATASSFTGTTGVNNFTGGDGDDSFDFSTAGSFQDIDNLDGGAGTDTAVISYSASGSLKPSIENIENVTITNSAAATNDLVINAVDTAAGYDIITNLSSTGGLTINNLIELPTKFVMNNSGDDMVLDFQAEAVADTADNLLVDITGTGAATTLALTADGAGDIETLTLNSIAQPNTIATLDTSDVDVASLVITGDQLLTITNALSSEITTIDASAASGGVTLNAQPGVAAGITYTGGAGNDVIQGTDTGADNISTAGGSDTITIAALGATDVIDGGAGADTLVVAQDIASATVMGGVSNVETLEVTGARDIDLIANVSTTTFDFTDDTKQTLDIDEGYTNETTVLMSKVSAAGTIVDDAAGTDSFINLANVTSNVYVSSQELDGAAGELTITGGSGTDNLYVYLTGNPADPTTDDALGDSITNFETITIMDAPGGNTATAIDLGANYTIGTGKDLTVDASALDAADTGAFSFDASDLAAAATGGKVTYTDGANAGSFTGGNNADTITMGAGNDTVVGTAGSNIISLGDGADSVTAGSGIENISAGAGNDTINMGANLTALDTVDGGDGVDKLTSASTFASATILGGVSNVETLALTGDGASVTLASNISATTFDLTNTDDQTVTLNAGYTDTANVTIGTGKNNTSEDVVNNGSSATTSANTTLVVTGAAGAWTGTSITGGTGTDTVNIVQAAADTTAALGSTVTGVEFFNITDSTASNTADVDVTVTTYATAATWDATSMDNGEDTTINLTNASAAQIVLGGESADAITGGSANDTITGNGGADVINGGAGLDNISSGAGNDAITAATEGAFSTTLGTDTVDAGAGTDSLTFSAAATLTTAEVANISNVEILSLATGSTLTINNAFLDANPGIVIQPGATSTIKASTATGDSLTTSLNIAANAAGNLSVLGGSGDDTFTFYATETLTALDSIDGGTGDDTIILDIVDASPQAGIGADATAVLDASISGIENVTIRDVAITDGGAGANTIHTATVTVNAGFTGTSLTIDGSQLDAHPTTLTSGERLSVDASNNAATEAITVTGGAFSDSIIAGLGIDNLTGGAGADTIKGGGGADIIVGGAGADTLEGEAGIDNISAGDGNDTISITDFSDFKESGGAETVDGGAGNDTMTFSEGAALTLTAPEMEAITGIEIINASDDIGSFASSVTLGNGFFTSNGSTTITYDGNDSTNVAADNKLDLSSVSNGSAIFYGNDAQASAVDTFLGGSGDDTWIVTGTTTNITGATDVYTGNGGEDQFLIVNTANTTSTIDFSNVTSVEKAVTQYNSSGAVIIVLGSVATTDSEPATFTVDGSSVTTSTGSMNFNNANVDEIAMATAFTLKGGVNADTLSGGYQADTITGNGGADDLRGNTGADTITGGSGADTIAGGAGADNLTGLGGIDEIDGGAGNDTINAGDGADIIDAQAGKDIITTGAGRDTVIVSGITDSAGANFNTITDFVSASDNIRIVFTLAASTTFTLKDRGDTASEGTLPGIMAGVIGDAAFVEEGSAFAIDFTGDGIVNANDFKISATGATAMSIDDFDMYLTASNNGTNAIKTAGGADSIVGGTGADTVYTYAGNDTITGSNGSDVIWAGAGNDTITLGSGAETVIVQDGAGSDTINTFTAGTDIIWFSVDGTTPTTASGANAVVGEITVDAVANGALYDFTINTGPVSTSTLDIANLDAADLPNRANANLKTDLTGGNGAQLFIAMATSGQNDGIGSIKVTAAGDKFYIASYDTNDQGLYIYHADSSKVINDASITVNEVTLVAFVDGVADDALAAGNTFKMYDLTNADAAY
jgi:Ca2+-binding RTX toxin-like protein